MKLYIVEIKYGFFKRIFHELAIMEDCDIVPVKDDFIHLGDKRYLVLQRVLFSPTIIKLYVRKLW